MTRYNVVCGRCDERVVFRHAGETCDEVHGSPYIIECDCTGIPVANWNDTDTPKHWNCAEKVI